MIRVALVTISDSARGFDLAYSYMIPDEMVARTFKGARVIVPFGGHNRTVEGIIIDFEDVLESSIPYKLKAIKKVIDEKPLLENWAIELCKWMKKRYICTYYDALKCMLPPGDGVRIVKIVKLLNDSTNDVQNGSSVNISVKKIIQALIENGNECEIEELKIRSEAKNFDKHIRELEKNQIVSVKEEFSNVTKQKRVRVAYIEASHDFIRNAVENDKIKNIRQIRALEVLMESEHIAVSDLIKFSGASSSMINTLKKNGYIAFKDIEAVRDPYLGREFKKSQPFTPTPEQAFVLNELCEKLRKGRFEEVLLHGVTGSGKTEVYLQLIKQCFDMGKDSIVLVPEISLTPQMVERFKSRFGDGVAVLHSRLSPGERYDQWRLISEGKIKVVVGARSAIFAPFKRVGIVIIDEEHENSYKSETTPKYHARDIARERCKNDNAMIICGSATPSVDTYYQALNGQIGLYKMLQRPKSSVLPSVEIVDMREELNKGNRSIFSSRLSEEITKNLGDKQQTILFLNRRGHSSFVLCRNCGLTMTCPNCSISLTYHAHSERLICHYCGFTVKNPSMCPKCKSKSIRHFGTGTQKIEDEVKKNFNGCTVVRMDMDTTSHKNAHEKILTEFKEKNIDVMIGTQMIAKGHDFPKVTLVGVLAADSLLNIDDFRASEKTFQLITQVAGRAGRGELPGRVIIQTYNTESFSIRTACKHDYESFYRQEILLREKLGYPPFSNIGVIIISGLKDNDVMAAGKTIRDNINSLLVNENIAADVFGPARAPLSMIKNKFRWRIVIKCKDMGKIIEVLSIAADEFYKKKDKKEVEISVDINPFNML